VPTRALRVYRHTRTGAGHSRVRLRDGADSGTASAQLQLRLCDQSRRDGSIESGWEDYHVA